MFDRRPFEHRLVAVGVAEAGHWPAADEAMDADRLPLPIVDQLDAPLLDEHRLVVAQLVAHLPIRADHLVRRNPVNLFSPHAHEVGTAAGDDIRGEAVIAEEIEDLEHRLVGEV